MTLGHYLQRQKLTPLAFARLIGVSDESVRRYVRGRVPESDIMRRIIRTTAGRVMPNDFFENPKRKTG
jgi:DNA-binding transcriptional regulator YdaS (Cro superfamily)